jgi:hypothetical protein
MTGYGNWLPFADYGDTHTSRDAASSRMDGDAEAAPADADAAVG